MVILSANGMLTATVIGMDGAGGRENIAAHVLNSPLASSATSESDRRAYEAAETEARASKRGLWKDANPTPPWEFRHPGQAASSATGAAASASDQIIGNKRSMIYHLPNCPDYNKISEKNREYFKTKEDAEKAGYRAARNCP